MAVITISRQHGSGGNEVARRICDQLGYRLVDKEIIAAAANEVGLSGGEVVEFTEQHSKARSFIDRILYPGPYVVAQVAVRPKKDDGAGLTVEELDKAECLNVIRSAIHAAYREGNAVIVGRGGQAALKGIPGVLHVRIVAPIKDRVLHLQQVHNLGMEEAYHLALQQDKRSADYLKHVFGIDVDDPLLYHLVVNIGLLALDQAVLTIVQTARQMEKVAPEAVQ